MPNENKKIVQDVVPPRRSIRDVELPPRKGRSVPIKKPEIQPEIRPRTEMKIINKTQVLPPSPSIKIYQPKKPESTEDEYNYQNNEPVVEKIGTPSYTYEYEEPVKKSRKGLYIAGGLLILAIAFGISALFKSAKITITPRHETHTLTNLSFTAKKDDTGNNLGFQIVTTSKTVEKKVTATGQEKVTTKASGKIVIFNNYSSAIQKLVATTRFQTPEGLIFRLPLAVSIPGRQTVNGKVVPGSIEVTVVADAIGEAYNIGLKDFTIPGFKGNPKYSQIYARSKTAMTGGFNGIQKIISPEVLSSTDTELQNNLRNSLGTDIISQIPTNFILYKESMTTSFSPVTQVDGGDGTAIVRKKGTSYAIIFDKGSLSRAIIGQTLTSTTNDTIKITNLEKLKFAYPDGKAFDPASANTTMTFTLSGDADFVWTFDENKLQSDLLGLSKTQATELLKNYSAIQEAWISTSPFWNTIIPKNQNKVSLVNTLGQ